MDIGRRQNADPRWILPLLCRRGHITRNEIGAIRIAADETHFQVPRAVAAKFPRASSAPRDEDDPESGIASSATQAGRRGDRDRAPKRTRRGQPRASQARPTKPRPKPPVKGPAASGGVSVRILVDADACPVKDEIYRVALRHEVPVTIVSNSPIRVPQHPLIERVVVSDGFDAADDWIAEPGRRRGAW